MCRNWRFAVMQVVGERCICGEAIVVRRRGVYTSENAGMSSER